jgi:hypothetical protein
VIVVPTILVTAAFCGLASACAADTLAVRVVGALLAGSAALGLLWVVPA